MKISEDTQHKTSAHSREVTASVVHFQYEWTLGSISRHSKIRIVKPAIRHQSELTVLFIWYNIAIENLYNRNSIKRFQFNHKLGSSIARNISSGNYALQLRTRINTVTRFDDNFVHI